jgi:hypothetical protein
MASQVMWKVVKPWIHPITRSKIELVGSRYEETFRAQGIVLTSGGTEVGPLLGPLLGPHARTLRSTQHAACSAHARAARRAPRATPCTVGQHTHAAGFTVGASCWQIPASFMPSWAAEMQRLLPLKKVKGYAPPDDVAALARI